MHVTSTRETDAQAHRQALTPLAHCPLTGASVHLSLAVHTDSHADTPMPHADAPCIPTWPTGARAQGYAPLSAGPSVRMPSSTVARMTGVWLCRGFLRQWSQTVYRSRVQYR
jgi:hypothetical protein